MFAIELTGNSANESARMSQFEALVPLHNAFLQLRSNSPRCIKELNWVQERADIVHVDFDVKCLR